MPKYEVVVTRWEPFSSNEVIEAPTQAEAIKMARADLKKCQCELFKVIEADVRQEPRISIHSAKRVD